MRAHRTYRFRWEGRTDSGRRARDGEYHLRLGLRRQGRTVTSPRKVFLDTRPPRVVVRSVTPDVISPDGIDGGERAVARFTGPTRTPELLVYRTDLPRPRLVARRPGERGSERVIWDGLVGLGAARRRAPTGSYALIVRARDAAGNVGPRIPPRRGRLPGNPGVTVRYLAARGPLTPVAPQAPVRFSVFAEGRRYRWRVRRLGSSRSVDRGSSRARSLTVRAPVGRSGVALLELRAGSRRYTTPFAVNERRGRGVLVVLPAATWQAHQSGGGRRRRLSRRAARVAQGLPAPAVRGHGTPARLPHRRRAGAALAAARRAALRPDDGHRAGTPRRRLARALQRRALHLGAGLDAARDGSRAALIRAGGRPGRLARDRRAPAHRRTHGRLSLATLSPACDEPLRRAGPAGAGRALCRCWRTASASSPGSSRRLVPIHGWRSLRAWPRVPACSRQRGRGSAAGRSPSIACPTASSREWGRAALRRRWPRRLTPRG